MPYHLIKEDMGWRVHDNEGNYYSNTPMSRKKATLQLRALYSSDSRGHSLRGKGFCTYTDNNDNHHIILQGNGFFSDIYTKLKTVALNVASKLKPHTLRKVDAVVKTGLRNDYPPDVRNTLSVYGSGQIYALSINRDPIKSYIDNILNVISLGRWNSAKEALNYDKLYHLSIIVSLSLPNGDKGQLKIEKNEVINITHHFNIDADSETIEVPVQCCVSLNQFLQKGQQQLGESFFKYDAFTNNCQAFILGLLSANNLSNASINKFVNQNAEALLKELPEYVPAVASLTTNIAGLWNRITRGRGEQEGGRIFCGNQEEVPAGYDSVGTRGQCFKKGVGVGMILPKLVGGSEDKSEVVMSELKAKYDALKVLNDTQLLEETKKVNPNATLFLGRDTLLYIACGSPSSPGCGGAFLKSIDDSCMYWTDALDEYNDLEHYAGVAGVGTAFDRDDTSYKLAISVRKGQEASAIELGKKEARYPPVPKWSDIPTYEQIGADKFPSYIGFMKWGHYCPKGCSYYPWSRRDESDPKWKQLNDEIQQYGGIDSQRKYASAGNEHSQYLVKMYDAWYDPSIKITIPPETIEDKIAPSSSRSYNITYFKNGQQIATFLRPDTAGLSSDLLNRVRANFNETKGFINKDKMGKKDWVLQVEGSRGASGNTLRNYRKDVQDDSIAFNDIIEYDKDGNEKFDDKKHLSLEWLNSVEGKHRRDADPYFEQVYQGLLKKPDVDIPKLEKRYEAEVNKRYGNNKEIIKPGTVITDSHGNKRQLYKVQQRTDGGFDIQWRDGTWEYTEGESEWDCNKFNGDVDSFEDWGVCGTDGRKKASASVDKRMTEEVNRVKKSREDEYDNLSGWDKFVNGLNVAGAFTLDYVLPAVSFIPGVGTVAGTIADATALISDAIIGDNCRTFGECTDRMVEGKEREKTARVQNSLYHETVGDSIANKYFTDDAWTEMLEGNEKAQGLVRDTINYGSRAGKLVATGSGKSVAHEMKQALRKNAIPRKCLRIEIQEIQEDESPLADNPFISRLFAKELQNNSITPSEYLKKVRAVAEKYGYDSELLMFSDNDENKLMIITPDENVIRFGRVGYGDYIIWSHLESVGSVRKGYAEIKRRVFVKSHSAIKGAWKTNDFSPNNLALRILWNQEKI